MKLTRPTIVGLLCCILVVTVGSLTLAQPGQPASQPASNSNQPSPEQSKNKPANAPPAVKMDGVLVCLKGHVVEKIPVEIPKDATILVVRGKEGNKVYNEVTKENRCFINEGQLKKLKFLFAVAKDTPVVFRFLLENGDNLDREGKLTVEDRIIGKVGQTLMVPEDYERFSAAMDEWNRDSFCCCGSGPGSQILGTISSWERDKPGLVVFEKPFKGTVILGYNRDKCPELVSIECDIAPADQPASVPAANENKPR